MTNMNMNNGSQKMKILIGSKLLLPLRTLWRRSKCLYFAFVCSVSPFLFYASISNL
ncbi:hypothetical protein K474DRAFT_1656656 [Panus rudis PR-1116 ss-1]|nr:hypothetical protein K474DRAFT_1656656 [Panus rudis PR-1116 ss-1]